MYGIYSRHDISSPLLATRFILRNRFFCKKNTTLKFTYVVYCTINPKRSRQVYSLLVVSSRLEVTRSILRNFQSRGLKLSHTTYLARNTSENVQSNFVPSTEEGWNISVTIPLFPYITLKIKKNKEENLSEDLQKCLITQRKWPEMSDLGIDV